MAPSTPDHVDATRAAYERDADGWAARSGAPRQVDAAVELAAMVGADGPLLDIGCGPGWHLPHLGPRAIGVDLTAGMTALAAGHGPVAQADLRRLPFATGSVAGAWASRSYVHVPQTEMPMALAELHRVLAVGAKARLWLFEGAEEAVRHPDDSLPGRTFSYWPLERLRDVVVGAGFGIDGLHRWQGSLGIGQVLVTVTRLHSLPDYVEPGMRLLVCGLNPSPSAADSGVGFFRAGNRFWPAALEAGLVTRDRAPVHALRIDRVGMTDLVKRTTRRADELAAAEYADGLERLRRLAEWLRPEAICMVGLSGWRAGVDRRATAGWQPEPLGGVPVYLMPSTSGLNAHETRASLTAHLRAATA